LMFAAATGILLRLKRQRAGVHHKSVDEEEHEPSKCDTIMVEKAEGDVVMKNVCRFQS
jgi:hypothetical protein